MAQAGRYRFYIVPQAPGSLPQQAGAHRSAVLPG